MSRAIYDELVAAGAPELPEGYAYKVVIPRDSSELRVYLQRSRTERRWWGGTRVVWDNIESVYEYCWEQTDYPYDNEDRTPVGIIVKHCKTVWERHFPDKERREAFKPYLGRHP